MVRHIFIGAALCWGVWGVSHALPFAREMPTVPTAKHGAQGTGNYKGKRDRHEKPTPMHEKKRKSSQWAPQKK